MPSQLAAAGARSRARMIACILDVHCAALAHPDLSHGDGRERSEPKEQWQHTRPETHSARRPRRNRAEKATRWKFAKQTRSAVMDAIDSCLADCVAGLRAAWIRLLSVLKVVAETEDCRFWSRAPLNVLLLEACLPVLWPASRASRQRCDPAHHITSHEPVAQCTVEVRDRRAAHGCLGGNACGCSISVVVGRRHDHSTAEPAAAASCACGLTQMFDGWCVRLHTRSQVRPSGFK